MALSISEDHFNEILTAVGFPIITPNLLELTPEQIKQHLIWPALREYWKWFPIRIDDQIQASATFEIPFPTQEVFGVMDVRLTTSSYRGSGIVANPLINEMNINIARSGRYGTRNNYETSQAVIMERLERVSTIEYQKVFRANIDNANRKITGYTNTLGVISVKWASYSEDFEKVNYLHIEEVENLARANILRYLGMLRNQDKSDLPNEMDGSDFISRAEELEEKILNRWKSHSKIVLLRS